MRNKLQYLFFLLLFFNTHLLYANVVSSEEQSEYVSDPILENIWIPERLQKAIRSFPKEERILQTEFKTTVQVSAECVYPRLYGDNTLIDYVNKKLETSATALFESFVKYEEISEEVYDQGFGGCTLVYQLFPVYSVPNLISVYGFEFQDRACPHGWTHYQGKNFWQNGNDVIEFSLENIFIKESDWCRFLLNYCENHFKSRHYGYYQPGYGITPELELNDLDIFVLTEQGLMIIFRSYTVGGWADGPATIVIPYQDLKRFIDPNGPLKEIPEIVLIISV